MKKRTKRLMLFGATLFSLSAIPVASLTLVKNVSDNVEKTSTETQAVTNDTNDFSILLNADYKSLSWYGTEFSSSVSETQLLELLEPSLDFDVNYGISIITPTDGSEALSDGYVEFAVYKITTTFSDGVATAPSDSNSDVRTLIEAPSDIQYSDGTDSGISMQAYSNPTSDTVTINGQSVEQKYVWTTKNIQGLFLPYKYDFEWNSNEQIGEFLESTTLTPETLSASDVYANMISTANTTDILPDDTKTDLDSIITIATDDSSLSPYGITQSDALKYGIALVTVDFSKSTDGNEGSKWVSGSVPKESYLVRGLTGTNGKETMHLNTDDGLDDFLNTTLSVSAIEKNNPNFTLPTTVSSNATTIKVSDFTPSQLINALLSDDNETGIMKLLTSQDYLSDSSATPALYLSYMGSNAFNAGVSSSSSDSSSSWVGTGLTQGGNVATVVNGSVDSSYTINPATESNISAISATSDDANGTLYLKVTYSYYDVYMNAEVLDDTTAITISGLQKSDLSSSEGYFFQWKSVDDLLYSNANDVYDLYNANKDNAAYLKALSNTFFDGTDATYALDRDVEMTVDNNTLTITLTFANFGDNTYTDDSGNTVNGLKITNTYNLSGASASSLGITFKSLSDVSSAITNYSSYTPADLIDQIAMGQVSLSTFYSTNGNYTYTTSVTQSSTNDGIIIEVSATSGSTTYTTSAIYDGLKTGASSSYVYNFAFGSSDDTDLSSGLATLKAIPFDDITVTDVYNDYVCKLPIYNSTSSDADGTTYTLTISQDDVSISKNSDNNSITVTIKVASYNSSDSTSTDADRTFTTTLNGFTSETLVNNNSNKKVTNLTVPLSVTFAVVIVIIMLGVLINLIIRRRRLNKSKVNLRELRKGQKRK